MVRRSSRVRQEPKSSYDEELKHLAEKKRLATQSDSDASDVDQEFKEAMQDFSDHDDDDDGDDDNDSDAGDLSIIKRPSRVSPPHRTKTSTTNKTMQVQIRGRNSRTTTAATSTTKKTSVPVVTRKKIQMAMQTLSKQILDPLETPENSLVAALLSITSTSTSTTTSTTSTKASSKDRSSSYSLARQPSRYTANLEALARQWVAKSSGSHDSNALHVHVLNLLFRSVGGSVATNFPTGGSTTTGNNNGNGNGNGNDNDNDNDTGTQEKGRHKKKSDDADNDDNDDDDMEDPMDSDSSDDEEKEQQGTANTTGMVDLDALDDAEWNDKMTQVVEVMKESPLVLFCASPEDSTAGTARKTSSSMLAIREYRAIYQEFWYRLGTVLLSYTTSTTSTTSASTSTSTAFQSNRFQVESMRDLVHRVTELVLVGQPDLRAAASSAIWELAQASLDRTVELTAKIETAQRQIAAIATSKQSKKRQALQHSLDTWKRHKAELEVLVEESILQGVFIRRYRDSHPHIRQESLQALRNIILARPDMFLTDTYLKYLGWMASDKDPGVRMVALQGLLAPFKYKQEKRPTSLQFDISKMQNVCSKFLTRILDCTHDSQSIGVQETAMELVLKLVMEGFMDDLDDDSAWDGLNIKALDSNTSPKVRKDALYLILDQIDVFDDGVDGRSTSNHSSSIPILGERQEIARINAICQWVAHLLSNGGRTAETVKVEVTDYIVESLRDMPEHKSLVTSWSAMLKAIQRENQQAGAKEDTVRAHVLLRFVACASKLEFDANSNTASAKKRKTNPKSQSKEGLSHALLKNLPDLLISMKTDDISMRSLAKLPQYIMPETFALPTRKTDFGSLLKNLCIVFIESTDEQVLVEIATSLSTFLLGNHARVTDVKSHLQRISVTVQDRLMELLAESDPDQQSTSKKLSSTRKRRSTRKSDSSTVTSTSLSSGTLFSQSKEAENEISIKVCLMRLQILLKQVPLSHLFDDSNFEENDEVGAFSKTLSEALGKRLVDRKPVTDDEEKDDVDTDAMASMIAPAWKIDDPTLHQSVAKTIDLGLKVLLSITAWKLREFMQAKEENASAGVIDENGEDMSDHIIIQLRDGIAGLIGLCYEQFLEETPGVVPSDDQEEFSSTVQASAGRVASDLRTLFPRELNQAKDPSIRSLALTNDNHLIGGFVRYLNTRMDNEDENKESETFVREILLPVARPLVGNWSDGNRKEAGMVLAHLVGSGKFAGQTVHAMARLLKKINPVRFLESQMAALRMTFAKWLDSEPEEIDTDHPSEQQMQDYEESEKAQAVLFQSAEHLASRLSVTLGVGRLTDPRLSQALLNFMQEGIRFAFEGNVGGEDDLVLGSRLPFLQILAKYASWIKRNKDHRETLATVLFDKEVALRAHPEFEEVHEDDLKCIRAFQEALAIAVPKERQISQGRSMDGGSIATDRAAGTPGSLARSTVSRRSMSVASSQKSRTSMQSNLSPLVESPESNRERTSSPSPQKRRRLTNSLPELQEDEAAEDKVYQSDSSGFSD